MVRKVGVSSLEPDVIYYLHPLGPGKLWCVTNRTWLVSHQPNMDASSSSIQKYMISLLYFSKDYWYACERGAHWGEVTPFLVAFCFKRSPPFPTEPFVASSLAARAKARGWVPGDAVCGQCFQRNSCRLVNKIFHTLTLTLNVRKKHGSDGIFTKG